MVLPMKDIAPRIVETVKEFREQINRLTQEADESYAYVTLAPDLIKFANCFEAKVHWEALSVDPSLRTWFINALTRANRIAESYRQEKC